MTEFLWWVRLKIIVTSRRKCNLSHKNSSSCMWAKLFFMIFASLLYIKEKFGIWWHDLQFPNFELFHQHLIQRRRQLETDFFDIRTCDFHKQEWVSLVVLCRWDSIFSLRSYRQCCNLVSCSPKCSFRWGSRL